MDERGFTKHLTEIPRNLLNRSKIIIDTGKELTPAILTNQAVRQGRSRSPTLFNVYMDNFIRELKNLKELIRN